MTYGLLFVRFQERINPKERCSLILPLTHARSHLTQRSFKEEIRRDSVALVCMFKGILCSDHVGVGGHSYHAGCDHPEKTLEGTPVEHIFTLVLLFLHIGVLKGFAVTLQEADGLGHSF